MTGSAGEDKRLFDQVFNRHRGVIFAYLFGQTGHRDTAADLLQETFIRVWQHVSDVQGMCEDRRRYWIVALARNVVIDFRRRATVRAHLSGELPTVGEYGVTASHEQTVMDRATIGLVDAAIRELPDDLRTVLTMTVMGDLSSDEIGQVLARPAGTVRSQLSEARRRVARRVGL